MIKLGTKVRDKETKFEGIVTARAEYLHDRPRVLVESIDSTGRPIEWWYDETRVEEVVSDRTNHLKPIKSVGETIVNKVCKSEDDHEWECVGISTGGTTYRCTKCFAHKTETYPFDFGKITVSLSN